MMGKDQSINSFLAGFISIYFVLQVALMQRPMHDEVLRAIVRQHNRESSEISFYSVEFQKS